MVIDNWLRGSLVKPALKTPRPHQTEALDAILQGLEDHDRVTSVMACGTGKTLTALWLAERLDARRILVLVPSLALLGSAGIRSQRSGRTGSPSSSGSGRSMATVTFH